jgi:hypothetical protein
MKVVRTLWSLGRGALPAVVVATLVPLALFYSALMLGSVTWAIGISLCYGYMVSAYQFLRRGRVSGMLMVTVLMGTVRAVASLSSGHEFIYFAMPVVQTVGFGVLFLATMFSSEPLVVRIARDLVPKVADGIAARPGLIRSLSLLWTVTYLASGATTLALLTTVSLRVYLGAHTLTGWFWTCSAIVASIALCQRSAVVSSERLELEAVPAPA